VFGLRLQEIFAFLNQLPKEWLRNALIGDIAHRLLELLRLVELFLGTLLYDGVNINMKLDARCLRERRPTQWAATR